MMRNSLIRALSWMVTLLATSAWCAAQETGNATADSAASQASAPTTTVPADLRSARATMRTFLDASEAFIEKQVEASFTQAAECLDWSGSSYSVEERQDLVRHLKGIIDRIGWVDLATISADPDAEPYHFPDDLADAPIEIAQGTDGAWRFTSGTVARLESLWQEWKDKPVLVSGTPWYRAIKIGDHPIWRIGALFLSILVGWIAGRVLRWLLGSGAATLDKRERIYVACALRSLARAVVPLALIVGLHLGLKFLLMPPIVESIAQTILSLLLVAAWGYVGWCLVDVVKLWLHTFAEKTDSRLDDMLAPMVITSLRITIVVLTLVQMATVLSDKPMTSIIAGLGVGGLAIGLAAQDSIKNFFGSIMIFSDRPFELGERIQVEGFDGTVESVGFRSTRLRTLDGHLVTMPNGNLANQSIRNVSKRPNIRQIINIGITYDTPPEKVQLAIDILEDLIKDHEGMDPELPPHVLFNEFQDSSLNLFLIYWYHPTDWWAYCAFNQRLNMEIYKRFNDAGIDFAFPSQTIYLAGGNGEPSNAATAKN